ncbi:MAG: translation initiation factor 2, partial [Myxococcales bacterium]|nr:translation initiation factor 2 [Myxococcales bacterium]
VATPSLGAPVAAPALGAPPVAAPSLAAPPIGAPAAAPVESKPSVRGWTLIMDDPEEAAAATPVAPAPAG